MYGWWHLLGLRNVGFVAGCGHTGTTLLSVMLSAHPSVYVPMYETEIFRHRSRMALALPAFVSLARTARRAGKETLIEKTPRHVRRLSFIRWMVPGAKFILMVRDGRDVVASLLERNSPRDAVKRWLVDTRITARNMYRPDVHLVRYEDLIDDPEKALAGVCAFVGIPFVPAMLAYHERPRLWGWQTEVRDSEDHHHGHKAHRNWQVNQPLFDGRHRWRKDLPEDLRSFFDAGEGRQLLTAFGYAEAA